MNVVKSIDDLQGYFFVIWLIEDEPHIFFLLLDDGLVFFAPFDSRLAHLPVWTSENAFVIFSRYYPANRSLLPRTMSQPRLRVASLELSIALRFADLVFGAGPGD